MINEAWLTAAMIAVDLLAFAQTLLLHDTGWALHRPCTDKPECGWNDVDPPTKREEPELVLTCPPSRWVGRSRRREHHSSGSLVCEEASRGRAP